MVLGDAVVFLCRVLLSVLLVAGVWMPASAREGRGRIAIVPFEASAFPYRGPIPDQDKPFLDVTGNGRKGHTSPRGGVYWEDTTYSSRDVLLSIPRGFDPQRPAVIIVYFHGNQAKLARDVRDRQRIPQQVADSGLNAVLVAPQMAVDALDSSAGNFWTRGFFARFLDEAAGHLARLHGGMTADALARAPVILVSYSGGYLPTAFALERGGAAERIRGVILLDGLYAEEERFANWIGRRGNAFFFSAYSDSTRTPNMKLLDLLKTRHVRVENGLPRALLPASMTFYAVGPAVTHHDFLTRAWTSNPLKSVLSLVPAFKRAPAPTHR